jgi:hypothetical protein
MKKVKFKKKTAKLKKFSVLLLYPDYMSDTFGHDTIYIWTMAADSVAAVRCAQRKAVCHRDCDVGTEEDFHPLLVISGHRKGLETGAE